MRDKAFRMRGFDAEWRGIDLLMVEGDMVSRCEVFDEADLDAAIARFEQLSQPTRRLENAASRLTERLNAHFAARDWDAMTETMAEDLFERRSSTSGGRGSPTWSGCRDRKRASGRRRRVHGHDVDSHRDPRAAPRPQS